MESIIKSIEMENAKKHFAIYGYPFNFKHPFHLIFLFYAHTFFLSTRLTVRLILKQKGINCGINLQVRKLDCHKLLNKLPKLEMYKPISF
jgi:hypothetical protein